MTQQLEHPLLAQAKATRENIAKMHTELRSLNLRLLEESRKLKDFTAEGASRIEAEIASEMIEAYLAETSVFLENIRGRMERRLDLIRRSEPVANGKPENSAGHGPFWYAFSRLTMALKRAERTAGG